jgi:hypothetical protein
MKRILLVATVGLHAACSMRPGSAEAPVQVEQPRQPDHRPFDQANAEDLYKDQRYAEATWIFEHMLQRPAELYREDLPRNEFWLAKSRFQIGDYTGSLSLFLQIAGNPEHPYHLLTLPWLSSLAMRMPDSRESVRAMALDYPPEILDHEAFDDIRDELCFRIGQWHVHHGEPRLGRELLARVPRDSDFAISAQFELGELLWREGRINDGIGHHRNVLAVWSMQVAEYEALPRSQRRRRGPLVEPPELEGSRQRLRSQNFVVDEQTQRRGRRQ